MSGPRVLVVAGGHHNSNRYRCIHTVEQLRLLGVGCELWPLDMIRSPTLIGRFPFAILHRVAYDRHVAAILQEATRANTVLVYDIDDLSFSSCAFRWVRGTNVCNPFFARLVRDEFDACGRALREAHATLASTEYLANRIRYFGSPALVHRNAFSLEMLSLSERAYRTRKAPQGRVIVGYASGTPTHDSDFLEILSALRQVLRSHQHVELWLAGHLRRLDVWDGLTDRVRWLPFVPWQRLPTVLAAFDVNLAPLEPGNPFCEAKSEIKYIEAALVRVPTVASPTDAFQYAIRPGENGFLARDTGEWIAHLERLVSDATLRRKVGQRAYEDVIARYHPSVRARELLRLLNDVSGRVVGRSLFERTEEVSIPLSDWNSVRAMELDLGTLDRVAGRFRRALYTLRYHGVKTFLLLMAYFLTKWIPLRSRTV